MRNQGQSFVIHAVYMETRPVRDCISPEVKVAVTSKTCMGTGGTADHHISAQNCGGRPTPPSSVATSNLQEQPRPVHCFGGSAQNCQGVWAG